MMRNKKELSLKRQTAIWSIGLIIQFFAQWLISVLLVRMSGYEAAGIFALAMTVSNIFAYFANYGIRGYQVSHGSMLFSDGQFLIARILTVLISTAVCGCYLAFAPNYTNVEIAAIFLYLAYNVINTISDTMQGSLQVKGHLEIGGYSNALRGLSCFAFFMIGFKIFGNLIIALIMMMIGTLVITIVYDFSRYHQCVQYKEIPLKNTLCASLKILGICFPLMLSQTVPILTTAIPRRTIQTLFGADMLGIYSSIFAPAAIILTLIPAIVTAILPKISQDWQNAELIMFTKWIWMGVAAIPALCVFCGLVVLMLGEYVLRILFGEEILTYASLFYWAMAVAIFSGAVAYYNGIMTVMCKLKAIAILTFVALLITLVLAHPLIHAQGLFGAARLQIIAYVVQVVLQMAVIIWFVHKRRMA